MSTTDFDEDDIPVIRAQVREIQLGHADHAGNEGREESRIEVGGVISEE